MILSSAKTGQSDEGLPLCMLTGRMVAMEYEEKVVALTELYPDRKNARKHDERNIAEIKRSLQQSGQFRPFVVQKSTMRILVGNGMYTAMRELGYTEARAWIVDCSDTEATKIALSDNRTAELAQWDFSTLKDLMQEIGPEPDVAGWSDTEIEDMFQMFSDGDTEIIEDEVPEVQKEAVSQRGYIWLLGNHRVMCGDSTLEADTDKLANGEKADMVFTDPPYNVAIGSKNKMLHEMTGANYITEDIIGDKGMTDEEIGQTLWKPAFEQLYRLSKDDCSLYVTMPQGGTHMMMMMMMMASAYWQVKHELMWLKNAPTFSMGRLDYDYQHEPILYGWKKTHNFYGKGKFKKSVWEIDKAKKCDLHPTMKPIELIANALLNSSQENDAVFDFFGGSGSTLIACEQLKRRCYTMELDPHYVDVIVKRWQNLTGKEATLEGTGETFNELKDIA